MRRLLIFFVVIIVSVCSVNAQNKIVTGPKKVGQNHNTVSKKTKRTNSANGQSSSPKAVDLGLSVKWADRNVGARSIYELGKAYIWGETSTKKHVIVGNALRSQYESLENNICGKQYDAARVNWGKPWRMPTKTEMNELATKCKWKIIKINGKRICKVTGPNGNYIYILTGDEMRWSEDSPWQAFGFYWCGEKTGEKYQSEPWYLRIECTRYESELPSNVNVTLEQYFYYSQYSIRPVCD